jgi:hypothetical protein
MTSLPQGSTPLPSPVTVPRRSSSRKLKRPHSLDDSNFAEPPPGPLMNASSRASRKVNRRILPTSKRKATSDSDSTDALHQKFHAKSIQCIEALNHQASNALEAKHSLSWLHSNPEARNVLMSVSPKRLPAYSTIEVLQAHVGPHTQDGFLPIVTLNDDNEPNLEFTPVLEQPGRADTSVTLARARAMHCANFVLPCIWQNYPNLSNCLSSLTHGAVAFAKEILGSDAGKPHVHVPHPEFHRRMLLADEAFHADTLKDTPINRPNSTHAKAWQGVDNATLDKRQILIDACASWFPILEKLNAANYLDVLAGVTTPASRLLLATAGTKKKQPSSTAPRNAGVEHVQLKRDTGNGKGRSHGSVFHLQNCFSPAFVEHAMEAGIPSLPFMRDGMKPGKDRLSRIACEEVGVPFRLRSKNPYLMLSDAILVFEAQMLTIGNFLNAHLHAHVKKYVASHHGNSAVDMVVPPLVIFDMIQSSLNSVLDGGYGKHDDSGTFVSTQTFQ